MNNLDEIKAYLQAHLSDFRYQHSLRVANEAKKIAKIYKLNEDEAYLAGLIHDVAHEFSEEENLKWIKKYNLPKEMLKDNYKNILHSDIGALVVKEIFNVSDKICESIVYHTIGNINMNIFDKIIFIADKISRKNLNQSLLDVKDLVYKGQLDYALLLFLEYQEKDLEKRGLRPNINTIELVCKLKRCIGDFMLEIVKIDYNEFKKDIYPYYLELFPREERKTLRDLKNQYKKGLLKFVKIVDENIVIGFLIYEVLENVPLVLLDYFAIYPEYQNKKYGTEAIEIFKTFFSEYDGVYGEVEKIGFGENNIENETRVRRIKFWENLGFRIIPIDLELFGVIYSPCILKIQDNFTYEDEKIIEYAFAMYNALLGQKRVKKYCRVLKKE